MITKEQLEKTIHECILKYLNSTGPSGSIRLSLEELIVTALSNLMEIK